jgi:uncharacterized protein YwlG (UPF0340 family)
MCYPASKSFADVATSMTAAVWFILQGVGVTCRATDVKREYGVEGRYNAISAGCTANDSGTLSSVAFVNARDDLVVSSIVDDLGISVNAGDYIYVQLRLYY